MVYVKFIKHRFGIFKNSVDVKRQPFVLALNGNGIKIAVIAGPGAERNMHVKGSNRFSLCFLM
jgi:hypothetical protein